MAAGQLEARILGPLEVLTGGEPLALGAHKQRALLALLATRANEVVSTDELIESLWAGKPPKTAATTLQVYVSRLRKLLEPERAKGDENHLLISRAPGYVLSINANRIDARRFESLADEARRRQDADDAPGAASVLREALALWRGAALAEFVYEPWAQAEATRLEELRLSVLEERIAADLASGRHSELVAELETLLAEHPLRERLHGHLMIALYRASRQAEALEAYQRARTTLTEELGLDPSPELRDLNRRILTQDTTLAAPERTPSIVATSNLPTPPTRFIGRELELAAVVGLVSRDDVRLASLTGPGGTGKTRLALQAAEESRDAFPAGVFWVPLATLRDPMLVPSAMSQALGVQEQPGRDPVDVLCEQLAGKRLLVLLDNAEHLLPDLARTMSQVHAVVGPTVLVTTRERLQVAGEHAYAVPELDAADAVELFVTRAAAAGVLVERTPIVDDLCARLEHLPLALELAASRTPVLTPQQVLERLSQRLDLLKGGRDADPRQQTLRATITWSYDLLTEEEQRLFRALAVFAGGCTLEAAEQVTDADLDTLQSLVEKSLLRFTNDRYWMLETIREFAVERLRESPDTELRERHATHVLAFAKAAAPLLRGAEAASWLDRLEQELDNVRSALDFFAKTGGNGELELASAVSRLWWIRGYLSEGERRLEAALGRVTATPSHERAHALHVLEYFASSQGDYDRGRVLAEEALRIHESLGEGRAAAFVRNTLGANALYRKDWDEAQRHFEASRRVFQAAGEEWGLMMSIGNLGELALERRDFASAVAYLEEALSAGARIGWDEGRVGMLASLGAVALQEGRTADAADLFRQSLGLASDLGHIEGTADCIDGLSACALVAGDPRLAARLVGAATMLREEAGIAGASYLARRSKEVAHAARAALGADAFTAASSEGRAMPLERVIEYALASID